MSLLEAVRRGARRVLSGYLPPEADAELTRRASIALGFSVIGIVFLGLLGIVALREGEAGLAIVDTAAAAILSGNLIYLRQSKNIRIGSHVGVYTITATFVYFLAFGGQGSTTYVWCFTFPLVSFFLLGSLKGLITSAALLAAALAVFLLGGRIPGLATYPVGLQIRFTAALVVVILFSYLFEFFRSGTQRVLGEQNRQLQERMQEIAGRDELLERVNRGLAQEIEHRRTIEADLAAAKEQAVQASLAKSRFLANMSHELRTPLNHILGFSELLYKERLGELAANQKEHLRDIVSSGQHLLSLINDVLDLAKIEAGRAELTVSSVDPRTLLEQAIAAVAELARAKSIQLTLDCGSLPSTARLDERKVKQILFNLLSNAVKFTDDGGWVRVKGAVHPCLVRPGRRKEDLEAVVLAEEPVADTGEGASGEPGRCLECSVADNGIGIAPQDQARLFQRFVRLEPDRRRTQQGTGLGLALCRHLVELHGGRIWAESPGTGQGSTFTFVIPWS